MKKKYYLFTTSTNTKNGGLFNNTVFCDGYEMPSWKEIKERVCNTIRECKSEPVEDSTIILFMAKLTKQEYEALQDK